MTTAAFRSPHTSAAARRAAPRPPAAAKPGPSHAAKLNWLRAGVLGANDGIISTAGLVVGVAGATTALGPILTAGIAGLVAGAVSMALGEYVSVSSQRDAERALIARERVRLAQDPEAELAQLAGIYRDKGASAATALAVASELTAHDPIAAHLDAQLRLDPDDLTNPSHAALSSGLSFTAGAVLPILAVVLTPAAIRIPVTFVAVILALAVAGGASAALGSSGHMRAVARLVLGGAAAMVVTYGVGSLLGSTGLGI
ncbi:VIT1/CCC1 transporter family protein [Pengzhenrongella sicca]|uniref:VIT family protein n=1 Tax=Pengzhenrongella sicca TaxID=2819238 RepID=A0A8A4ZMK9_9MICO|nr:VIT family protein [Pengzhenrongella sicca]QTE30798.1 VIT family protein [Pengzhenrongella sicca]